MKLIEIKFLSKDIEVVKLCTSYIINYEQKKIIFTELNKQESDPHTFKGWDKIYINDKVLHSKPLEIER